MKKRAELQLGLEPTPYLIWTLPEPMRTLSWALQGGGFARAQTITWIQVGPYDLKPDLDADAFLRQKLTAVGTPDALGFMTSARIEHYTQTSVTVGGVTAQAAVTVGLGNALRAGDPSRMQRRIGTINCACSVNVALNDNALIEAMVISAEAKTAAVLESGLRSGMSGLPATGTGTDCHAIACLDRGPALPFAGKHTEVGSAIGAAVLSAVAQGVERWIQLHPGHPLLLDRFQELVK